MFSSRVVENCAGSPFPGAMTLRNAAEYSTFIRELWTHPQMLQSLSDAAGVPLSIVMPTEIAHTNIQTSGDGIEEMKAELRAEPDNTKVPLTEEQKAYHPLKAASGSIFPWHYDSYPYVCIIMLSDTDGMLGGQTFIKGGDGVAQEVPGPQLGHGVMLQGGEVQHLAARAVGVKERITTITSFVADVPGLYDSSYITNIRRYSAGDVLYRQWTQFRLEKMRREIEALQMKLSLSDGPLDVRMVDAFAQDQIRYLKRTSRQLIPPDQLASVLERYGGPAVHQAAHIFSQAESLTTFAERAASVTHRDWCPYSPLWVDLEESRMAVQAGQVLESQRGRARWAKDRDFSMGDELLRQGLPELLLLWLEAAGLYSVTPPEESLGIKEVGFVKSATEAISAM